MFNEHNLRSKSVVNLTKEKNVKMVRDIQAESTNILKAILEVERQSGLTGQIDEINPTVHTLNDGGDDGMNEDLLDPNTMTLKHINLKNEKIDQKKALHLAKAKLLAARARKIAGFVQQRLEESINVLNENKMMARKKNFPITDPVKYEGKSQKKYEFFLLSCENAFTTRPVTYKLDASRVVFGQNYLRGTPAMEWKAVRETTPWTLVVLIKNLPG